MSFGKVYSVQITFLEGQIVNLEVDITLGLHSFTIIGLPDKAIEESKDRVSSAIKNSGFVSPRNLNKKVVVSLSPADFKKEGTIFDLAIAIGFLLADKQITFDPQDKIFLGELSLDGKVLPIKGALPLVEKARKSGFKQVFLPKENISQVTFVKDLQIFGVESLQEVVFHLLGKNKLVNQTFNFFKGDIARIQKEKNSLYFSKSFSKISKNDFCYIKGQDSVKRALEIGAVGRHNIIMYGAPGVGKTMLANAFISILPDLEYEEIFEVTSIHSVLGLNKNSLVVAPPFRAPHHTSSYVSIVGGGSSPRPGEITLAHKGVLFLDEFPEFDRRVLESLRQPLERKEITITRANTNIVFPADFVLIASMNPCPCGYLLSKENICKCRATDLERYKRKLSGPIMDRIDMWVFVGGVDYKVLDNTKEVETSAKIKERVLDSRKFFLEKNFSLKVMKDARDLLEESAQKMSLSIRGFKKILKIATTIAVMEKSEVVKTAHVLEALQYRSKILER